MKSLHYVTGYDCTSNMVNEAAGHQEKIQVEIC